MNAIPAKKKRAPDQLAALPLSELHPHPDDPFSVRDDDAMMELFERSEEIKIGKHTYPTCYVQDRFRRITGEHIRHVLDGFAENTTLVHHSKAYILASLFNTTGSMDSHYMMRVQHDMYGE